MMNDDVVFIPGQGRFWRVLTQHLLDSSVGAVGPCSNFIAGTQSLMHLDTPLVFNTSLLIGMCLLTKLDVFKEVGMLDASLPGGDDLDFSIRLLDAGYDLRVDRTAYLHHLGQQTGRRVHGEEWDSKWMQEVTNNALIEKHGVKKWYECFLAQWCEIPHILEKVVVDGEDQWYEEQTKDLEGLDGLNLGCGDKKVAGTHSLDIRRNGNTFGAGGQKGKGVDANITADAGKLPLKTSSKDYIVASHVLEHILNPLAALKEWKRVLKPGGRLFLTTPNHHEVETMLIDYTHIHAFDSQSLWDIMDAAGFENVVAMESGFGVLRATAYTPTQQIKVLSRPMLTAESIAK